MKIKTSTITLNSFSIPNYILPTFQKARVKEYSLFLGIETDGSLINDFLKERNND